MPKSFVWHRRDLRTRDNPAVEAASSVEGPTVPLYIADPGFFDRLMNQARARFVVESLRDLNARYRELGTHLLLFEGDPVEVLRELAGEEDTVFFTLESDLYFSRRRDEALEIAEGVSVDPVDRSPVGSRENWEERLENYFQSDPVRSGRLRSHSMSGEVSIDELVDSHAPDPEKPVPEPGRKAGEQRLRSFLEQIELYGPCVSKPLRAEETCSRISPHLAYGTMSVREVYRRAGQDTKSSEMFRDRLAWNLHMKQKLEDNPDLTWQAVNPVYRGLHEENRDEELICAWKHGETGYPMVDASMRSLVETGWINFRMRAMAASFYSYILKQPWKTGADFFYRHLIDSEAAINYYQWQMQSGLVGVHANRIYDPTKQKRENDPRGEFIREYIPELRPVPDQYLAEPWKMPEPVQEECGVEIGRNYPGPVVDFDREADEARKFFRRKAPEAYRALLDDEVWRKASLSDSHSREEIRRKADQESRESRDSSLEEYP